MYQVKKGGEVVKAFIFPGQGCQKQGMGKDLYEKFPVARDLFDRGYYPIRPYGFAVQWEAETDPKYMGRN